MNQNNIVEELFLKEIPLTKNKKLVARISVTKTNIIVDIRKFYNNIPTRSGISVILSDFPSLVELIASSNTIIESNPNKISQLKSSIPNPEPFTIDTVKKKLFET